MTFDQTGNESGDQSGNESGNEIGAAPIDAVLLERLAEVAGVDRLLVGSDYDGTLSMIVRDRDKAKPVDGALEALYALAAMPATQVAVISGRGRGDLERVSGLQAPIELIGSHGVEYEHGFEPPLTTAQSCLQRELRDDLMVICGRFPALTCEVKPGSLAIHYRDAPPEQTAAALDEIATGPAKRAGVRVRHGLEVIELTVLDGNKGDTIRRLRVSGEISAAVFIGDDVTDEDAFDALGSDGLTIKVGPGPTRAAHRVAEPHDVARVLTLLGTLRQECLSPSGRLGSGPVK